jgi:diguanylate cyclase (GGDEF)-like protein/PAS domain S-box-containing protein
MSGQTTTAARTTPGHPFLRRFTQLILLTWNLPPVVGLGFILYLGILSPQQVLGVLTTPLLLVYIFGWMLFAVIYYRRLIAPLASYLDQPGKEARQEAVRRLQRFPLHFWGIFLFYILLAPLATGISAELYTDFIATDRDWFRLFLLSPVVSIIVGLPIFFLIMDHFGSIAGGLRLTRPHVTLKAKVFLIGALTPLLIDTMIVQYYWSRTDYFTQETFFVWLSLEVLAVLGSLLFVRSINQSLLPLTQMLSNRDAMEALDGPPLAARSTDELGMLASGYGRLLQNLKIHTSIVELGARQLHVAQGDEGMAQVMDELIELCRSNLDSDILFLILHDEQSDELVGVAHTGASFNPDGYYRLPLNAQSLACWSFIHQQSAAVPDTHNDPRVSSELNERFGIRSALAAPLRAHGKVTGVMMSVNTREQQDYDNNEIGRLETFAAEVALAVYNQMLLRDKTLAEEARHEREEQVRLLLDYSPDAIYGADLNGICTFINPTCLQMLGYTSEEDLLGQSIHKLIHHTRPDGQNYPKSECAVRHATMSGEPGHSDQEVHWRADGTSFPVEWWSQPIYRDGKIVGTVVTFIDITERKQAEAELKRLGEYNRLLLESTGDGIFGVDRELRCTFANHAAADMLGFDTEELTGKDMHQLVMHSLEDGEVVARNDSHLYRALHQGESFWVDDTVLWHKGKDPFPVQYSCNPIREHGDVTGAVIVFRNVAEARAMSRKMDYLATHDALTGLVNRREFEKRLTHALEETHAGDRQHVLCYMDLDQFKVVNDTCGHVAGDELLRQLTTILHDRIRKTDTLARLGGDEFGVLFDGLSLDDALNKSQELLDAVQDFRFVWEDKTFSIGASIGVVAITAETENSAVALSNADSACYIAKDSGRNRLHVYQQDDRQLAERRGEMQWVSRIRHALDQQRLRLACQAIEPVSPASPDDGMRFEILLRMKGEHGELIPPGAFLPAAERYNLMPALDRWVVEQTMQQLSQWHPGLPKLRLCTINLSGSTIGDESFLRFVEQQLRDWQIPANRICFEITETAAVANLSKAIRFIRHLKEYGCRFALDDFGSGMSSFAYLKNLPVDFLKIDGNFVRDIANDPIDRAMVAAIHQVGSVMGIRTIAEFVEDEDIRQALSEIGVDFAQGYGIHRPQTLAELMQ